MIKVKIIKKCHIKLNLALKYIKYNLALEYI